jgi:hypothetical protein
LEYQLSANRKSLEGGTNPDRNAQFDFINEQSAAFLKKNLAKCKNKGIFNNFRKTHAVLHAFFAKI